MKRIITLSFLFLLTMALVACGGKTEPTTETPAEAVTEPAADGATAVLDAAIQQNTQTVLTALQACPQRTFPVPEPDYNSKRPRDFSPFTEAMAGFTPEQAGTMDSTLAGKTIPEIQELLNNGDFTSEQLVLYYLDRIQRYDIDKLNAVMELNPEALTIARALDEGRAAGTNQGALHGIPVLLKDNIATGDQMHTTAGTYALKEWQADRDAFIVQQLRDAGAIIMGKANLSEWANYTDPCMPNGFSAVGGQVRHAYGPYDPLGSSTGSAVSVAANLTTVSVGTETAGSIIQPARTNSIVALRPSQGLTSRDYIVPLEANLDTPGPMGRTVTDVAVMLTAMAGTDVNDPKTADAAALAGTDFTQFLSIEEAQKLKVGVILLDATIAQALALYQQQGVELTDDVSNLLAQSVVVPQSGGVTPAVADALEAQGIEMVVIKESELPPIAAHPELALLNYGFQDAANKFFAELGQPAPVASLAEAAAANNEDAANRVPYGQRYVEWSVETTTTDEEYQMIVSAAQAAADQWIKGILAQYDVDVLMMGLNYTQAGAAGVPALTVPAGHILNTQTNQPGEPTGVILTGDYLSDGKLIAVGYALEQALMAAGNGRVDPDLDATLQQIEAVTGN